MTSLNCQTDTAFLNKAMERLTDAFIVFDCQWNFIYLNAAACTLFDASNEQLLGQCAWDVCPGSLISQFEKLMHRSVRDNRFLDVEEYFEPDDRWYNCRCYPNTDGLTVFIADVTERRQAIQMKAHQAAIVESSTDAVIGKTREGIITSWNRGAQQIYGYSPDEVVGKSISVIVPENRLEELGEIMRKINEGERFDHFETVRRCKDGRLIDVSFTASPICDPTGKIIGASAIARDISEKKKAIAAIHFSEMRLRLITDSVPVLIGYVNADQCYEFVNQMYEEWFGLSRDEICGKTICQIVGKRTYKGIERRVVAALSGERQTFETKLPRVDHPPQDVQVEYVPYITSSIRVEGFFVVVTNLTRVRQAEVEAAMLAASDRQREFIGRELHDTVVQELAGASMMAESLRQKLESQSIHDHLAREIVDVLNDAQQQARRLSRGLIPVEIDAAGLMNALQDLAEQTSRLHHVECTFRCHTDVLIKNNFAALNLYRIAQEATHNAIKHAQAARIKIALNGQHVLRLSIKDDGDGFSVDRAQSTASGLRIMRYRAESIGGELTIESADEQGTLVLCSLRQKDE